MPRFNTTEESRASLLSKLRQEWQKMIRRHLSAEKKLWFGTNDKKLLQEMMLRHKTEEITSFAFLNTETIIEMTDFDSGYLTPNEQEQIQPERLLTEALEI